MTDPKNEISDGVEVMDLTKIDKPFGELDRETQSEILLAHYVDGAEIEFSLGDILTWEKANYPEWRKYRIYRSRPEPLRDMVVPWDYLPDWVQYVALDQSGTITCHEKLPTPDTRGWFSQGGMSDYTVLKDPGNKPWTDSLVRRPK